MKKRMNKMQGASLILLLSMLNGNILSMQESDISTKVDQDNRQELNLLDLPAEIIEYIIYQIIKPYESNIENVNNVFDCCQLDLKPLKEDLFGVVCSSKDLRLWTLYLIDRLKKLKEKKCQKLVNQIKVQYKGLSKDGLNGKLRAILTRFPVDRRGLEKAVKLILSGANVNQKGAIGYNTALTWAVACGHKDIVQLLIGKGANVNEKGPSGYTALMLAAMDGHKDIVKLLIDSDANVNEQNNVAETALIWAVKNGHKDVISLLQNAGAKANHVRIKAEQGYNCIIS